MASNSRGKGQRANGLSPQPVGDAKATQEQVPTEAGTDFRSLRERLLPHAGPSLRFISEMELPPTALAALPQSYRRVMVKLDEVGLLEQAIAAYLSHEVGSRLDFAWPSKRAALRVVDWPHSDGHCAPEFARTDARLRDHGWLIFPIDPNSQSFDRQFDRAVSVIKRMTVYRR